jgi:hypothetical protein
MGKIVSVLMALLLALAVAAVAAESGSMTLKPGDEVYVCNCGTACPCDTMANKAGNCSCGKPLVQGKVKQVGEGTATIQVGTEERSFKTVGKYACACGSACTCGTISQNPGKCVCGKEMAAVKVN